MKPTLYLFAPLLCASVPASAQLFFPGLSNAHFELLQDPPNQEQPAPIPPMSVNPSYNKPGNSLLLADVLPLSKSLSIFTGFTRSFSDITNRVGSSAINTTILAPSNSAISSLPRKPWEDPNHEDTGGGVFSGIYRGIKGEDRASRNLKRFVEAHLVGVSPWETGQKVKTLEGVEVWWEDDDGVRKVCITNKDLQSPYC